MRTITYRAAMRQAAERVSRLPSRVLQLPWADIEYVDEGSGPPVLISHGIYGGHDTAADMTDLVLGDGFRTVGPSRFGYFGSTLPVEATPDTQADAYVSLLDHLGIDQVIAVGYSAGAPSMIALALRHPDRVRGLILAAGYLPGPGTIPEAVKPLLKRALGAQRLWWLLRRIAPGALARIIGVPHRFHASTEEQQVVDRVIEHLFPISAKKQGAVFDTLVSEPASNAYLLENITVPTLLLHAPDDPLADYRRAMDAAGRIPGAQLVTIPRGGHLFLGSTAAVHAATATFVAGTRDAVAQPVT
jgi:2-hydroxy-6-oxonona-2,4-dienedioate hydrolase